MSALPDICARRPRASAYISGKARVPVLQLICNTFGTLKICQRVMSVAWLLYITILIVGCDFNVTMMSFIVLWDSVL